MKNIVLTTILFALSASPLIAEERFAVNERDNGIIRVDTKTGRISFCNDDDGKPVCKMAAVEREAWMAEVDELEKRIRELEARSPLSSSELSKNEEKQLDKSLQVAEEMFHRFFGMVKSLKKELETN